jgi:hypothetical protein
MQFGWKRLLPIALANFVITGTVILLAQEGVFDQWLSTIFGFFSG